MSQSPYERLVVGINPYAANARNVRRGVIDPLMAEAVPFEILETDLDTEDAQIELYRDQLRQGDRLLLPGGDGTYHRAINALRLVDPSVRDSLQIGLMAYGNRCDTAWVGGKHRKDVLAMADDARYLADFTPLRVTTDSPVLDAVKNRLALGYVTIGDALAQGAAIFNSTPNRYTLHASSHKFALSARIAMKYYLSRIGKFAQLPDDATLNSEHVALGITDIIALNGPRMATLLRNGQSSYSQESFEYTTFNANSVLALGKVGLSSLVLGAVPTSSEESITVEFGELKRVMMQADGEPYALDPIARITVDKDVESFRVITE